MRNGRVSSALSHGNRVVGKPRGRLGLKRNESERKGGG